jgi:hypothetical protein
MDDRETAILSARQLLLARCGARSHEGQELARAESPVSSLAEGRIGDGGSCGSGSAN